MEAVLFIGHGSRKPEGNEQLQEFVNGMKHQVKADIVETCFLEFAEPSIAAGIEACVKQGATKVALVPMMFFSAGHAKIHIPADMDKARQKFPLVSFTYGRPIGSHPGVIDILADRLKEAGWQVKEGSSLVIVGRGSSDGDANSELYKISRLLSERLNMTDVELSFIGVTSPTVEQAVERSLKLGASSVCLLPYFFFSGVLMDRMEEKLEGFKRSYPDASFLMTKFFGFHPLLATIFKERAEEALQGLAALNCDNCQYRLFAKEHLELDHNHDHHHHHHH
ncbi:sirohydrochlorin chelatase [Alkalihalobacillus oceani]|uniref:sirohydrochlorin chelatase n=1 Tax=Halalkalibacter oceani TaxID=1653776 RepID=UPI00203BCA13|nr:sirohydrochlorin chelatase [Halalkalibacter oceani]MCM3760232.1 sirohydrochlorin chelatase [Halalkalibacter oceani]